VSVSVSVSVSEFGLRACGEETDSHGSGGGSCVKLWNTFTLDKYIAHQLRSPP